MTATLNVQIWYKHFVISRCDIAALQFRSTSSSLYMGLMTFSVRFSIFCGTYHFHAVSIQSKKHLWFRHTFKLTHGFIDPLGLNETTLDIKWVYQN